MNEARYADAVRKIQQFDPLADLRPRNAAQRILDEMRRQAESALRNAEES